MKITIKLLKAETLTDEGYPLNVVITHQGVKKTKKIAFAFPGHWIDQEQIISVKHPDYDILMPIIADLKIRARKIMLQQYVDIDKAYNDLFKIDFSEILFMDFFANLISEMKLMAENLGKVNNFRAKNKLLGNIKVYENVFAQFGPHAFDCTLKSLDYATLMRFRNHQTGIGNSKSTVNLYLRTLRAVYNKGISFHKLSNERPFVGIFKGLNVKSYNSRKKYLSEASVQLLEQYDGGNEKQKYVDLFLLQFYFGGCDLIDVYYLKKKQFRRGRVLFERMKTDTGTRIDLKVHPKAEEILKKYECDGDWLLPWPKEREKYEVFRRTYQRGLIYVQEKLNISVLPEDGNLGAKVARHTFATRAKQLRIDEDIIRELMGHERNDVDNFYKDKYPEAVRDEALFRIIG